MEDTRWELRRRYTRHARELVHLVELLENPVAGAWRQRALCRRVSSLERLALAKPPANWESWGITHEVTCTDCIRKINTLQGRGEWIAEDHQVTFQYDDVGISLACSCGWVEALPDVTTPAMAWAREQEHRRDVGHKRTLSGVVR